MTGGILTLTTGYQQISPAPYGARYLNLRSATGNGTITLSVDGKSPAGFLLAGEARQYINTSPHLVWALGTAGNTLYWDAV